MVSSHRKVFAWALQDRDYIETGLSTSKGNLECGSRHSIPDSWLSVSCCVGYRTIG